MEHIAVKIIDSNIPTKPGMSKFLARMTQRGHLIGNMDDLMTLADDCMEDTPSEALLSLPHTTIMRMNYITVAVTGLSTKCVSQLRTHAKRLTFLSTSTQYSPFDEKPDAFVFPYHTTMEQHDKIANAYNQIQSLYKELMALGMDKDDASYVLPQGLRKCLVISGPLDAWQEVMRVRLCHRNSLETQLVMHSIYDAIRAAFGERFVVNMLPTCTTKTGCREGKFCCGHPVTKEEFA